jgi:hypothetical protein
MVVVYFFNCLFLIHLTLYFDYFLVIIISFVLHYSHFKSIDKNLLHLLIVAAAVVIIRTHIL